MADTTNPESTPETPSTELPIPKLETPSAGSSTSGVDTEALAREVAKLLRPDIEKTVQSTKYKRIARLEKQLGVGDLSELEEMGVTIPENVRMEYRLRNLEQGRSTPEVPGQTTTSQGSGATLTANDVSEVIGNLKLDANDPQVLEKLRSTYRNRDHFESTMAQLALAKASKPTPSVSATPVIGTQPAQPTDKQKEIVAEYETELAKIPRGNQRAVSNLKTRIRQKARENGFIINI